MRSSCRTSLLLVATSMVCLAAASAQAAVIVTTSSGLFSTVPGVTTINFNDVVSPKPAPFVSGGYTFTGDGAVVNGSVTGKYATPFGDTTNYLTTGFDGVSGWRSTKLLLNQAYTYFGLLWGSIDTYNELRFFKTVNGVKTLVDTIQSGDLPHSGNGSRAASGTKYVNIAFSDGQSFDRVDFITWKPAFEVDNLAFGGEFGGYTPAVPETSTWLMMILGFAGVGFAAHRRRKRISAPGYVRPEPV